MMSVEKEEVGRCGPSSEDNVQKVAEEKGERQAEGSAGGLEASAALRLKRDTV